MQVGVGSSLSEYYNQEEGVPQGDVLSTKLSSIKSFPNQKHSEYIFFQLRKQHDDPVFHLYGSLIPVVEESEFLGILFDR